MRHAVFHEGRKRAFSASARENLAHAINSLCFPPTPSRKTHQRIHVASYEPCKPTASDALGPLTLPGVLYLSETKRRRKVSRTELFGRQAGGGYEHVGLYKFLLSSSRARRAGPYDGAKICFFLRYSRHAPLFPRAATAGCSPARVLSDSRVARSWKVAENERTSSRAMRREMIPFCAAFRNSGFFFYQRLNASP